MHALFFPFYIYTSYFFIYSSFDFTYFQLEIAVKQAYLTRLSTVGKRIEVFPPTISLQGVLQAVKHLYKVPSQESMRQEWERGGRGGGMAFWCCSCLSSLSLTPPHWSPSLFPFYGFLFVTITSTWAKNKFGGCFFFFKLFFFFWVYICFLSHLYFTVQCCKWHHFPNSFKMTGLSAVVILIRSFAGRSNVGRKFCLPQTICHSWRNPELLHIWFSAFWPSRNNHWLILDLVVFASWLMKSTFSGLAGFFCLFFE